MRALALLSLLPTALAGQQLVLGPAVGAPELSATGTLPGEIRQAVAIPGNRFAVLNADRRLIFFVDSIGRSSGDVVRLTDVAPLVRDPRGMTSTRDGRLVIVDGVTGALTYLAPVSARGWKLERSVALGLTGVSGLCAKRDRLFVMGVEGEYGSSPLIHTVALKENDRSAFGAPFGDPRRHGSLAYGFGHLLCDDTSDRVIVASRLMPEIRGYAAGGAPQWTLSITPFQRIEMQEPDPMSVRYGYPPDSVWSEVTGVFSMEPGFAVVQAQRRFGKTGRPLGITTWLVDRTTGKVVSRQDDVPRILTIGPRTALIQGAEPGSTPAIFRLGVDRE